MNTTYGAPEASGGDWDVIKVMANEGTADITDLGTSGVKILELKSPVSRKLLNFRVYECKEPGEDSSSPRQALSCVSTLLALEP
ncbi:MAG TPA: hypothetical protein VIG71_11350 [Enteractinococcus sp.]